MVDLESCLADVPLVAILRGITPNEAVAVVETIIELGTRVIEVPLTSPDAFSTLEMMIRAAPEDVLIGCGTVTTTGQIDRAAEAGAKLIVSPHSDKELIACAKRYGLLSFPGFATSSEAFSMIKWGADALKLFPADALGPKGLAALRVVLPPEALIAVFGGITKHNLGEYWDAGANAFGVGGSIYRPGWTAHQVREAMIPLIGAMRELVLGSSVEKGYRR